MRVIFIIADTLRFDSIGINNPSAHTPFIDEIAKGRNYTQCYSAAPWTLPSCASILTGFYPAHHKLMQHKYKLVKSPISQLLREEGFYTVGITNNSNFDYNIGYQDFFDEYHFFPDGNKDIQNAELNHDKPFSKAIKTLKESHDQDLFLFLHTNIAHDYFLEINRKYYEFATKKVTDVEKRWEYSYAGHELAHRNDNDMIDEVRKRYDVGVTYLDSKMSELFEYLDLEKDLIIFVGDHGEGFDPNNHRIHHGGRMHNDLIHVPLFINYPDNKEQRRDRGALVSTTDLVPTILDELGLKTDVTFDGISLQSDSKNRRIMAEDYKYQYLENSFTRITDRSERVYGKRAILSSDKKVIGTMLDGEYSYTKYDLKKDYNESSPLEVTESDIKGLGEIITNSPMRLQTEDSNQDTSNDEIKELSSKIEKIVLLQKKLEKIISERTSPKWWIRRLFNKRK